MKWVGWLGTFFFSICAVPQAYECWIKGNADGISMYFLMAWLLGEILTMIFVAYQQYQTKVNMWPLLVNYFFNLVALLIIFYFKIFPNT